MSVSANQIDFRTLERALPYSPTGALAHLLLGNEHGPDNQRDIGMLKCQSFNLPIEWQSPQPHAAGLVIPAPIAIIDPEDAASLRRSDRPVRSIGSTDQEF